MKRNLAIWSSPPSRTWSALGCAVIFLAVGCKGPWSPRQDGLSTAVAHDGSDLNSAAPVSATTSDSSKLRIDPSTSLVSHQTPLDTAQEVALNTFLTEVRTTFALDEIAEAQLRKELRAARQEEWPLVAKQFRTTLLYRQELLAKEARQFASQPTSQAAATLPLTTNPLSNQSTLNPTSMQLEHLRAELAKDKQVQLVSHQLPRESAAGEPAAPIPVRGTTLANHVVATPSESQGSPVQPASSVSTVESVMPLWQDHLNEAISAMQQTVKPLPGSTEELQEHMRLRMLLLSAGREEDSLEPIPGASASEQDYWSKQLFAISALLDSGRQPDMKERAAGALVHLDQARARLGELASLQVRNLTFADKVDGYGLFDPHVETKFHPGDQVTLYTEVDNFRSESTKNGFRTSLATSYEVTDPQGRRVDGAQFPEVEDICQNLRHDFHMQYGLALPTRIYPGSYELRLTITDQLSNKIGHSTIAFEIVD